MSFFKYYVCMYYVFLYSVQMGDRMGVERGEREREKQRNGEGRGREEREKNESLPRPELYLITIIPSERNKG